MIIIIIIIIIVVAAVVVIVVIIIIIIIKPSKSGMSYQIWHTEYSCIPPSILIDILVYCIKDMTLSLTRWEWSKQ